MNIFVGNLSDQMNEEGLNTIFSEFGEVKLIKLMKETYTGRSRGFAFVEMIHDSEAVKAIKILHDKNFLGKKLVVNKAKPKTDTKSPNNKY